ncbi:hypothetical protein JCM19037_2575 [Geomicrobium sp. JCM 19037]|uniref:Nif3-like dinuclear metal center hexameric protein n=1 Tax=unclassified Geomicrobium TaxID=2628951 RepID=UPI00045F1308|nr:Nif3-like dinuclear metal center hexameric protein [Geomicrobium sp. JCM 19037]GAK04190.1 hypothetical protein JCM19037_2575 [Geomicrobium sp. JCM 19037]
MSKAAKVKDVIQLMDEFAPKSLAFDKDPIGLMIGDIEQPVETVLTTLDVTEDVVDEAVNFGATLIIAHHPLLFMPLSNIDLSSPKGRVIQKCLKHDISVYASHTNLDITDGGVNDMLAEKIGLTDVNVLVQTDQERLYKLVAFVPVENAEEVRQCLGDAGTGHIGDYSHCSFSSSGTGAFLPGNNTNPHIGEVGKPTKVEEVRIETIVPEMLLNKAISALHQAHPYEEVAYDLYPLRLEGEKKGLGRIGELEQETTLKAFAETLKTSFSVDGLRFSGDENKRVKKVAVLGGDGNNYWQEALQQGADVFVTGDLKFHTAQDALLAGLSLVDPGHHIEEIMKAGVERKLREQTNEAGLNVTYRASTINTDPFTFI